MVNQTDKGGIVKVEIETTTALPELKEVYKYLKDQAEMEILTCETVDKILKHGLIQGKVYGLIKKLEWAIDDKVEEVDKFMEDFLGEAEEVKNNTSNIKEAL